ncbi:unnamed protein product [Arabidopsis arenosa]|uniref:non-specific serine/threonine protein kinase n=1 Tax=Arabidopsis arenosa TaxID=38785 RepID=A0A8S1ZDS9_ARAAE|nr:unnamed protein product [Arabidopsis arenosa]
MRVRICFLAIVILCSFSFILVRSLNEEGRVLLEFKALLNDSNGYLASWNQLDSNPCNWTGIACTRLRTVTSVDLNGMNLSGTLSPLICKLHGLRKLNVSTNFISGPIPRDLSLCRSLEVLDLCTNRFHGVIPIQLTMIITLKKLYLCENYLFGSIPRQIGSLSSLQELVIYSNNLTGLIPPSTGKLRQLRIIRAGRNAFSGVIPPEISGCESLKVLGLAENLLEGSLPKQLEKLQNLTDLILWQNRLSGEIPPSVGNITRLEVLALHENYFTGSIPREIGKLTKMKRLYLYTNQLTGEIPREIGNLTDAAEIDFSENQLTGFIPKEFGQILNLKLLHLFENILLGPIPRELGELTLLEKLDLSINRLNGTIPRELQFLTYLVDLQLFDNQLEGTIPPLIGFYSNFSVLDMSANSLSGPIPAHFCRFQTLILLSVGSNKLSGNIPRDLKTCKSLTKLMLGDNWLTGSLPAELFNLQNLTALELHQNWLSGYISADLGKLKNLERLRLANNNFTGEIPPEIGNLTKIVGLNISSNQLTGHIPKELGSCVTIQRLDLSGNRFSGYIPQDLVPDTAVFQRMDSSNFAGNHRLCNSQRSHCQPLVPHSDSKLSWLVNGSQRQKILTITCMVIGSVFLITFLAICWAIKRREPAFVALEDQTKPDVMDSYYFPKKGFTYQGLVDATRNFSEDVLLGRGACGTVYKAEMSDGEVIAVKKLNSRGEGASSDNSFRAEISTLGKIRHRNIVKLYGFCYHQNSNLLLYEYMSKGSLGEQLQRGEKNCLLDWNARYRIALGAAEGLCYLHHDCRPQIVHRDIKSNNILLDELFQAHVGDFGLAKLIDLSYSKSMSAVAGSYGYIAPEYAYTMKVTEKCDIYSFGVVLLELITGKPPVQPLEQGGDLVNWVRRSIRNMVPTIEMFDARLDTNDKRTIHEMSLVLKIALFCTSNSPASRPTMREVVAMITEARGSSSLSTSSITSETPLEEANSSKEIDFVASP